MSTKKETKPTAAEIDGLIGGEIDPMAEDCFPENTDDGVLGEDSADFSSGYSDNNGTAGAPDFSDLAQYDQEYEKVKANDFGQIPDGLYNAEVESSGWKKTKSKGDNMYAWKLRIFGGEQEGRFLFVNDVISSEDPARGLGQLKGHLETMGICVASLTELRPADLEGRKVLVNVKNKQSKDDPDKIYQNVYFKESLDAPADVEDSDTLPMSGTFKG